jgi:aminoglycoside phosphotransferase (APT) family kinase protein
MAMEELSADYVASRGFNVVAVKELGGGVSNVVLHVETKTGCLVFKQSLPKLRVAEEWLFDQRRIINERHCMELLGDILPGSAPMVRFADDDNFIFAMTCAPPGGRVWKEALLDGDADSTAAERAGALLGEMHRIAAGRKDVHEQFADWEVFRQGRVDPYHRRVMEAHPDLAPWIEDEIERMRAHRVTLVHGDYSPKNLFVYPDRVLMLDFEVAHWGDPAFDVAFCLAHLLLTAIHFPHRTGAFLKVAQAYWHGYGDSFVAPATLRELACLLLARVDGKSKEDYITLDQEKQTARDLARWIIREEPTRMDSLWEHLQ